MGDEELGRLNDHYEKKVERERADLSVGFRDIGAPEAPEVEEKERS